MRKLSTPGTAWPALPAPPKPGSAPENADLEITRGRVGGEQTLEPLQQPVFNPEMPDSPRPVVGQSPARRPMVASTRPMKPGWLRHGPALARLLPRGRGAVPQDIPAAGNGALARGPGDAKHAPIANRDLNAFNSGMNPTCDINIALIGCAASPGTIAARSPPRRARDWRRCD